MPGTSKSGRKKIPASIKEMKGTLRPWRENKNAPKPERISMLDPPKHLNEIAAAEYIKKAELLDRLGVLKEGDDVALAAYAEAYARWVKAVEIYNKTGPLVKDKNGNPVRNPVGYAINNAVETMYRFLTEFGLTPASRTKIKVDNKPKENEWEEFSAGMMQAEDESANQYGIQ